MTINKFAIMPSGRWFVGYLDGSTVMGAFATLASTTITLSTVSVLATGLADAIIVGNNKVLMLSNATTANANIITDTNGTASAGTAITLSSGGSGRACVYVSGTDVMVQDSTSDPRSLMIVSCSGASPVLTLTRSITATTVGAQIFSPSNALLQKSPYQVTGTNFSETIVGSTLPGQTRVNNGVLSVTPCRSLTYLVTNTYSLGRVSSEVWCSGSTGINKMECVA
jgi:hypothetical protein